MPKSKFDWTTEIATLTSDEYRLTVPLWSVLGEAQDVAKYFREHYKADKKNGLPGLADAGLASSLADQIESLIAEASAASSAYRHTVDPKADTSKLERARFLISEIGAVLDFYLDDGIADEDDARLANVVAAHKDAPDNADALAFALEEYAAFASMHEKGIKGLGGFDTALIAEAKALATELRAQPSSAPSPASAKALARRNRVLQLLDVRVREVRAAAKFVFRAQPEIARGATSLYERKRRIDQKRAATRKKNLKPQPAPAPNA
ncbi:MAG: hypothetical protein HYV09_38425 [Deltaproteobacteria bacterium]|nr:hypothetical protein [Deltaproteobacteria bacterium]